MMLLSGFFERLYTIGRFSHVVTSESRRVAQQISSRDSVVDYQDRTLRSSFHLIRKDVRARESGAAVQEGRVPVLVGWALA
jgi:hypothetical protein